MQDTIIIGNGTSKQIKTASLPNSYAEFKVMAENGNLFADIKLNVDGCEIVGTPLNKLNLLTDETAEILGNAENVDEALQNTQRKIAGIPADLTGIYNTQVIGYDETQGKLVPMLSGTVPQQDLIPSGEIPRIWDITSEGDFSIVDANSPTLRTVETPLTSNDFLVMQVAFKKPYMLSEYSKLNFEQMNAYAGNYGWIEPSSNILCQLDVEISKKSDFSDVDMCYKSNKTDDHDYPISRQSVDITSLKGSYYIRMKLFVSSTATSPKILANKTLTFSSVWLS